MNANNNSCSDKVITFVGDYRYNKESIKKEWL